MYVNVIYKYTKDISFWGQIKAFDTAIIPFIV